MVKMYSIIYGGVVPLLRFAPDWNLDEKLYINVLFHIFFYKSLTVWIGRLSCIIVHAGILIHVTFKKVQKSI